jgi:hypothetical protein
LGLGAIGRKESNRDEIGHSSRPAGMEVTDER